MARALAGATSGQRNRIGIITNGGGLGILLNRCLTKQMGLAFPKLSQATFKKIEKIVPDLSTKQTLSTCRRCQGSIATGHLLGHSSKMKTSMDYRCIAFTLDTPTREYAGAILKMVHQPETSS